MVCIKVKALLILLVISVLIAITVTSFTKQIKAEEQRAELIFAEEPSYTLIKELAKNDEIIGWSYQIFVKIQNIGNNKSDLTRVNITDDEGFTLSKDVTIEPNVTETVIFDWATITKKDHNIHVSFYPTDLNTGLNQYNRGSTKIIIKMLDKDDISGTSTPGFELLTLIITIATLGILLKKYRK